MAAPTKVLQFVRASGQFAYAADSVSTSPTGNLSCLAWIKLSNAPASNTEFTLFAKHDGGASNGRCFTFGYQDSGGTKQFIVRNSTDGTSGNQAVGTLNYTLPSSKWFHLAFVYTAAAGTVDVYVNGFNVGTISSMKTSILDGTVPFSLGARYGTGSGEEILNGYMSEARVWKAALTSTEIATEVHAATAQKSSVAADWSLDNVLTDASGNSNTLTGVASIAFATDAPWKAPTSIAGSDLETNLVSYYKLDEASGTRADSKGSNSLTDNNTVASATGKINLAADFEKDNSEYLSIADGSQSGLDLAGAFTLGGWFKPESAPSGGAKYQLIGKYRGGVSEQYELSYRDDSGLKINLQIVNGGTSDYIVWSKDLGTGTFHHVIVTFSGSGSKVECFVDGVSLGVQSVSNTAPQNGTGPFTLGADGGGAAAFFDGLMDEIGVWSRELTYGEALDLYNAGNALAYAITGPSNLKTWNGLAKASIKTINGLAIGSVKSIVGLT